MVRAIIERGFVKPRLINFLLYPLSVAVGAIATARRLCWRRQWRQHSSRRGLIGRGARDINAKIPAAVIVVGNISVGGVGKTPVVIALVNALQARGFRPGIVTRGYRGRAKTWPQDVKPDSDALLCGDESVLLARKCNAPVVAGPNRARNAMMLVAQHGCNVIVSDDGFQHYKLRRDLDIVVIDGARGFGNGWCLPAGPLREPINSLHYADMILINHPDEIHGGDDINKKVNSIVHNKKIRAPIIHIVAQIIDAVQIGAPNAIARKMHAFRGQTMHAIAGVGNCAKFFNQLTQHGVNIVAQAYPDHHNFTRAELAAGDDNAPVIMTEKDAVKCETLIAELNSAAAAPRAYWAARMQINLAPQLIARVCDCVEKRIAELTNK